MLIDVEFTRPDGDYALANPHLVDLFIPKRLDTGLYTVNHFSGDSLLQSYELNHYPEFNTPKIRRDWENYPEYRDEDNLINCYGVCDSVKQLIDMLPELTTSEKKYIVMFVGIKKADEHVRDGWRWEKWGLYIGNQQPKADYLYDEPIIEEIVVYHIYEVLNEISS